jgi:hypothetical protein
MLMTFDQTKMLIGENKVLHIAGSESLLRQLPKGNWVGGSTEYFMAKDGGKVSGELLFVTEIPCKNFTIKTYSADTIHNVAEDAFDNGFSVVIVPFDSNVHKEYAQNAAEFSKMFLRNVAGWISGLNLDKSSQMPIAATGIASGIDAQIYTNDAVALHLELPEDKKANIGIINIFEQDTNSPLIEFNEEGFSVKKCLIEGKETQFADYIKQNAVDTKLPLVGDYSGTGINVSFKSIEDDIVHLYAPVFNGIKYRMAKGISDYEKVFNNRLKEFKDANAAFSCNCILNFLYGELEGKSIDMFTGPITFGEIAYQLVNQTLVYVTVSD